MSEWKAKRFWKTSTVAELGDEWTVLLDGRPVRSPLKTQLVAPTKALADAIAAEWDAQEGEIKPLSMPLTRAANATLDRVIPQKAEVADMLADYGGSDLLCYRADSPVRLAERQAAAWDPLLSWCEDTYGAALKTTAGVLPVAQPEDALSVLSDAVHSCSAWELTALHEFVTLSGSLVIGLAVISGHRDAADVWTVSRIDELWQEEQWGPDEEATQVAANKKAAFLQAADFLGLIRG